MKKSQRGSAILILIIIVVLVLAGLAYYLYSNPTSPVVSSITEDDIIGCYAAAQDGEPYMNFHGGKFMGMYSIWNPDNQPSPSDNGIWELDKTGKLTITPDNPDAFDLQLYTSVIKEEDRLILTDSQSRKVTLFSKSCEYKARINR